MIRCTQIDTVQAWRLDYRKTRENQPSFSYSFAYTIKQILC